MLLLNLPYLPDREFEVLGIVSGNIVKAESVRKSVFAAMSNLINGELPGHTAALKEARKTAENRMAAEAAMLSADAVINVKYEAAGVADGTVEVLAYGTAVKYK